PPGGRRPLDHDRRADRDAPPQLRDRGGELRAGAEGAHDPGRGRLEVARGPCGGRGSTVDAGARAALDEGVTGLTSTNSTTDVATVLRSLRQSWGEARVAAFLTEAMDVIGRVEGTVDAARRGRILCGLGEGVTAYDQGLPFDARPPGFGDDWLLGW